MFYDKILPGRNQILTSRIERYFFEYIIMLIARRVNLNIVVKNSQINRALFN
jgi:hypothetical protein